MFLSDRPLKRGWGRHVNPLEKLICPGQVIENGRECRTFEISHEKQPITDVLATF